MSDSEFNLTTMIPEGCQLLEYVAALKILDETGEVCLINVRTTGLSVWEAIGAAQVAIDGLRNQAQAGTEEEG